MKINLLTILTITLLTSCIGTNKFTSFSEPKFQEVKTNSANNSFTFDLTGLESKTSIITSTKVKSQFIPAILYWQWNNTIKCEINPVTVGQLFQINFMQYVDSLKISEKLQGRKLEMKVEKIPNSFVYTHKGNSIILIVAYTVSDLEAIFPQEQDLVVSYKMTQNGSTIKEGKLTASNKDQTIKNVWKSTKKFTWLYIDQFKQNTNSMAKEIVDKLVKEI
ncbi:hypothetical protein [Flavobacterium faecale]|uniref:hypothetical protein n=1 Tax=Flavobacterium faecale TaxID=1355330 RepID=UPI003AAA8801